MSASRTLSFLALTALYISTGPTSSYAGTLTSKLTFAHLPTTITLCRDSLAIQAFGYDEEWAVLIDVDGNASTGQPGTGAEFELLVQTLPQTSPCSPTVVGTADALVSGLYAWDGSAFQQAPETVNVALDFNANTMTLSADYSWPTLAALSATSRLTAAAVATYKPTSNSPTRAADITASTTFGNPITDPSGDVQLCSAPCSAAAAYYPYIDIVGFDPGSTPLQDFGVDTVTFEFDVANLPANIGLCLFPSAYASDGPGVDMAWVSAIDIENNGTLDVAVAAHTTPQDASCSSHTAPIATSVFAELDSIGPGGALVHVSDLPVSVDSANGRITVKAPRTDPLFAGLSNTSVAFDQTQGYYAAGNTFAVDMSPLFAVGTSFNDPALDVTNCSGNCSIGQPWYSQIDLVGGKVLGPDRIFRSGFE